MYMTPLPLPSQLTAQELANLSLSPDPAVREAVARHPNTSFYILGTLAAEFPAAVLENPALPLLWLADPAGMRRWPDKALLALGHLPQLPEWLRRQLLHDPKTEMQVALAGYAQLNLSELTALAHHPAWLVRARIAGRADLPAPLLELLQTDSVYGVRLALVSQQQLTPEVLMAFAHDPSRFVQQEARRRGALWQAVDT